MASCEDGDEVDEMSDSEPEIETPCSANKGKKKKKEIVGDDDTKGRKKSRSDVWKHFNRKKDNYDKCICNYCGKERSCLTTSGTTNLKKHLEACKQHQVWLAANKEKDQSQTVLTPDDDGDNLRLGKVSEKEFREASNELLVLAELPLSFIESLAWRRFCNRVHLYKPISRRTAARDIVQMYVRKKAEIKRILGENKQRLSLTTDIWTAPNTGASYMVVTAHYVDASWELRKLIIGFKNISDHKGASICKVLLECLAEWGIKKVFCITVDNATANTSAIKKFRDEFKKVRDNALVLDGDFLHIRCATHILNLVVKEGLQEINSSVAAVRNGVQFVRSSTNRLKSFELRVETGKIARGSLPLDVKTRWNSTYLMLNTALNFRKAFDKMVEEDKVYNDYFLEAVEGKKRIGPPFAVDWEAVESLLKVLVLFYNSTLVLSASTSACSYKCYNEIVTIARNLDSYSISGNEALQEKANSMIKKLDKYWNPFGDMNKLLIVASAFDPTKKMKFAQLCFDKLYGKGSKEATHIYELVIDILNRLFKEYSGFVNKSSSGVSVSSSQSQGQCSHSQSQDQVFGESFEKIDVPGIENMEGVYNELVKEAGFEDPSNELELYLKENVENPNLMRGSEFNVLSWWRKNCLKYPVLSLVARDILAMQVSSVASESAFSISGRILDPYRSCLTAYMIEVLMCTEQWLKCEMRLNDKGIVTIQQMLSDVQFQDDLMREFEEEFNFKEKGV